MTSYDEERNTILLIRIGIFLGGLVGYIILACLCARRRKVAYPGLVISLNTPGTGVAQATPSGHYGAAGYPPGATQPPCYVPVPHAMPGTHSPMQAQPMHNAYYGTVAYPPGLMQAPNEPGPYPPVSMQAPNEPVPYPTGSMQAPNEPVPYPTGSMQAPNEPVPYPPGSMQAPNEAGPHQSGDNPNSTTATSLVHPQPLAPPPYTETPTYHYVEKKSDQAPVNE